MTHSAQSGQTAPRTADFGNSSTSTTDRQAAAGEDTGNNQSAGQWGVRHAPSPSSQVAQNPAYGAPVHADAPTGTIPALVTGSAVRPAAEPASAPTQQNRPAQAAAAAPTNTSLTQPATPRAEQSERGSSRSSRSRGPRRARLQLRNINPWTVLKFSCVLSIALFFVWLIVIGVLFGILDAAGIIGKVNDTIVTLNGPGSDAPITAGVVFGGAAIIGVVNIVLFIALSTIGSIVYNLCADLVGGIEVTLSER